MDIFSTWGSYSYVGLTEVKIFDTKFNEIDVNPTDLSLLRNN